MHPVVQPAEVAGLDVEVAAEEAAKVPGIVKTDTLGNLIDVEL
jgi:hypothetical protein